MMIDPNTSNDNLINTCREYGITAADILRVTGNESQIEEYKRTNLLCAIHENGLTVKDLEYIGKHELNNEDDGWPDDDDDDEQGCSACPNYTPVDQAPWERKMYVVPADAVQNNDGTAAKQQYDADREHVESMRAVGMDVLPKPISDHFMREFENNKKIAESAGTIMKDLTLCILDYVTQAGVFRAHSGLTAMCEIVGEDKS